MAEYCVKINASDVAACIGLNPYNSADNAIYKIFLRDSPSRVMKIKKQISIKYNMVKLPLSKEERTQREYEQLKKQHPDIINGAICSTNAVNTSLGSIIDRYIARDRGIFHENTVLKSVGNYTRKKYFSKKMNTGSRTYILCGFTDGYRISDDGVPEIVEIKKRARKLFGELLPYEEIQLRVYLYLTDAPSGKLIEEFDGITKEYSIDMNDHSWIEIENGLKKFVDWYYTVRADNLLFFELVESVMSCCIIE